MLSERGNSKRLKRDGFLGMGILFLGVQETFEQTMCLVYCVNRGQCRGHLEKGLCFATVIHPLIWSILLLLLLQPMYFCWANTGAEVVMMVAGEHVLRAERFLVQKNSIE